MIQVEYRPDTYLGVLKMDAENRKGLEALMSTVVTDIVAGIDTTYADKLIITDNFEEDVLAFQTEHNYTSTGITNNNVARAQGKTLIDKETGRYTIFLDSNFGVTLVDDELFEIILQLAPGQEEECRMQRATSRNLVAHEFTHVEFESTHVKPTFGTSYREQLKSVAWLLYDEYNACRNAASIEPISFIPDDEKYVIEIERLLMDARRNYTLCRIDQNEFGAQFSEYTRLALIYIVSSMGDAEGAKKKAPDYMNCRAANVVPNLVKALHATRRTIETDNYDEALVAIAEAVRLYHEQFQVFITNVAQGEYWDIPVVLDWLD